MSLLDLAKELGFNTNSESGGNNGIYQEKHFAGMNEKQIKRARKKLRDNYVIPMLESICNISSQKEFDTKKASFIKLFNELFILQNMDFSVFGMLRNRNAEKAQKAQKIWEKYSKK